MDFSLVNQALEKEFGKNQVKVKPAKKGAQYEYVLWFKSDAPSQEIIATAKRIVHRFQPTQWHDNLTFHSVR